MVPCGLRVGGDPALPGALSPVLANRLVVGSTPAGTERGGTAARGGWESAASALCELGMAVFVVSGSGVWRERRPSIACKADVRALKKGVEVLLVSNVNARGRKRQTGRRGCRHGPAACTMKRKGEGGEGPASYRGLGLRHAVAAMPWLLPAPGSPQGC